MIDVYIINYNLLEWPKQMCKHIEGFLGLGDIHIVDNDSSYEPLLDWYATCPYKIHRMKKNYGHTVVNNVLGIARMSDYYVVTDPDLDISDMPADTLDKYKKLLATCPDILKVGPAIRIDDYPKDALYYEKAVQSQRGFWGSPFRMPGYKVAPIDTTFAMSHKSSGPTYPGTPALRSDPPYWCRHLPYYITADNMTEEYRNFLLTCNESSSMMTHCKGLGVI